MTNVEHGKRGKGEEVQYVRRRRCLVAAQTKRRHKMKRREDDGREEGGKNEITRLRQKMETMHKEKEKEIDRTEAREFKAAAKRAAAGPSRVHCAKVSPICSLQGGGGPSCDESEREEERGSTKGMKDETVSGGKYEG